MDKLKKVWKSAVIWFNSIAAAVISGLPMLGDSIPQMHPYLTPHLYQWIGGVIIFANIVLRFKTHQSLADK